jgi:hypothetical protein
MKSFSIQSARLLALAAVALASALPCYASLGKAPSDFGGTTARQAKSLAATSTGSATSAATTYTVTATTLASGTVVREYVNTSGVVFAVSWTGPFLPDLRTLLGDQFSALTTESARHPKAGHNRVNVSGSDVVIESGGHMRAYTGRAWITSLLPTGFDTDEIE